MPNRSSTLRVVVLGYIVRGPIGGMAWHHLQYVLGLKRLGHEVLFLEDGENYPSCYDPTTHSVGTDPSYGLRFAKDAFERLMMPDCWTYYDAHEGKWYGPASDRVLTFCNEADLVLNVSGVNPLRDWTARVPTRVLIDTDPVFTQVRHLTDENARERAAQHNVFLTFGESIGTAASEAPDDGFPWQATRQPIVLDCWSVTPPPREVRYTTIMQWDSYPSLSYDGRRFGQKSDSFRDFLQLPSHIPAGLEIALGSASAPRRELAEKGWRLVDPLQVTRDPWTYQAYIRDSHGEFTVAKQGYVISRCGWFSERSACYLASGRPVIAQDTNFSSHLPCGMGLHAYHNIDSALTAFERIEVNYSSQCDAAREIAEACFDSDKILASVVESAMMPSPCNSPHA